MEYKKHNLGRVEISRNCNHRCPFCSAPPVGGELEFGEVKKRIIRLKEEGTTDLMITGGEPTLKKDLFEILEFAKSLDFDEITIQSNGSTLSNKDFVRKLSKIKNLKFNVSFHASVLKIFGELSKAPGTFDATIKSLKNLGEFGIPVYLTIVIQKSNYKYLKSHLQFIRTHLKHITHFSFNFIDPIYNAKDNPWTVPTFTEAALYIREAFEYILKNNCTFRIEKIPLCFLKGFEHYQSNLRRNLFNETRSCSFLKLKTDYSSKMEFHKESGKDSYFYAPQCKQCKLNAICPGINNNYVHIHGYDEVKPVHDRNPEEILSKALGSKHKLTTEALETDDNQTMQQIPTNQKMMTGLDEINFKDRVTKDLELFNNAIDLKPNKNNVYDTYSFFLMNNIGLKDEKFILDAWKRYADDVRKNKKDPLISFYLHMPYCKTNCTFCVYPSTTMKDDKEIEDYLSHLLKKVKLFSSIFKGIKFKNFYMGGGTPSVFSEGQFDTLFCEIFSKLEFADNSERAIEFNPSTTTVEKLRVLEKHKFNKFSIGVQSLSKRVLKINKRIYQTKEMVENAINNFKKFKLNYINVDLLLGLKGDTTQDFLNSFEQTCALHPNNICIYPVKTNDNYIKENYESFNEFEEFYYPLFDSVTEKIFKIAEKYNYQNSLKTDSLSYVKPIIFSIKDQITKNIKYSYSHFSAEPYSVFCLGYYSHSRILNLIDYRYVDKNNRDSMFLKKFSSDKKDLVYDVDLISKRFERVKFIVQMFYQKRKISRLEYQKRYGRDIVEEFPYAIKALDLLKIIKIKHEIIEFSNEDEKYYYPYLLFFVGREIVLSKFDYKIENILTPINKI